MAKDTTALYTLFTSGVRRSFYTISKLCGNRELAKKLTEESYILSFANIDRLEHPNSYSVWMDRLSVYAVKNNLKIRKDSAALFLRYYLNFKTEEIAEILKVSTNSINRFFEQSRSPEQKYMAEYAATTLDKAELDAMWNSILAGLESGEAEAIAAKFGSALEEIQSPGNEVDPEFVAAEIAKLGRAKAIMNKRFARRRILYLFALILIILIALIAMGLLRGNRRKNINRNIIGSIDDGKVLQFANALSGQLAGQVGEVYKVGDDLYYVVIYLNSHASGGSLIRYKSDTNFAEVVSTSGSILSAEQLQKIADDEYMQVDYSPIARPGAQNNSLQIAVDAAGTKDIDAKNNSVEISGRDLDDILKAAENEQKKLGELFGLEPPEENFSIVLTIRCRNVNLEKTAKIRLDKSMADRIGKAGKLAIVLGDDRHVICLSKEQLEKLCEAYKSISIEMTALSAKDFVIEFKAADNNPIEELFGQVEVSLPADSQLTYVLADYGDYFENRGGRYDASTKTISFDCKQSGQYSLVGNNVAISDVDDSSRELQFMASTGFMPLDSQGRFRPDDCITRSELILALGKMFLTVQNMTGNGSTTVFTDINSQDKNYEYIVAGIAEKIIGGFSDGTFGGDMFATREEVLTTCARTLLARNVEIPKDDDRRLSDYYEDADAVSEYAKESVELAVKAHLIGEMKTLKPLAPVSRNEAAAILYKLYSYLYNIED